MVDSQPGTVISFNPSLSLSGFSAVSRDRFMFNENQLVLAKIQQPEAITASATNVSNIYTFTHFNEYRNLDGDLAYIDNLFYNLSSPGVPTLSVHRITIGFDLQVLTNTFKIWSVGFIDTTLLFAEYSFDNVTWFPVGNITWVQQFVDTIELFPGESPPTGEFVYTGTLATPVTARYWRLRSDAQTNWVSGVSSTITVVSTTSFPTSGSLLLIRAGAIVGTGVYTGKTATTFTGYSGNTPIAGDMFVNVSNPFGNGVTEVHIVQSLSPILQHWNSDGSQAVTNAIEGSNYLDLAYDKNDNVYYAIRFDDDLTPPSGVDPDDNFNDTSTGESFDSTRWIEGTENPYFIHSTLSGTLDMKSSGGPGQLAGNYGLTGDFSTDVDIVAAVQLGANAYFALEVKDYSSGNQQAVSALKGPYTPGVSTAGRFAGAAISYSSTAGSAAQLQDFRIKPEKFNFGIAGGSVQYQFLYNSSLNQYSITASGITWPNATPGVTYSGLDSATFTISNLTPPANGQGFTVIADCNQASIVGTATSGIRLEIERQGTNGYVRYKDSNTGSFSTLVAGSMTSASVRPQLFGHPNSLTVNLSADNFIVTGGTVEFDTPVLSVVTIDKSGNLVQVAGVSDSDGYVIKYLDVIRDPQARYNDFLAPKVAVATNGAAEGSGGEIYIKVSNKLYKYLKTSLPLVVSSETGGSASTTSTGEIPSTGITGFSYHGYSQAGLSYIEYVPDLSGVFLKTISTTDLASSALKVKLDVSSISYPFGWNVSDFSTLYYVDGTALKLYDLNESKAAFVNVTSNKQVLSAGTAETATITAQVLNVYGEPKSAKTMIFSVTAGDGAISPATDCSDVNGQGTTTYTVGSAIGSSTVTVAVSDTNCS